MKNLKVVETEFNIAVGKRIREQREKLGMTQAKLAEIVDMDSVSIYRTENGIVKSSGFAIKNISDALGVSTDYLLCKEE